MRTPFLILLFLSPAQTVESKDFSKDRQLAAVRATVRFDVGGSGAIVKKEGMFVYVLTANHVVASADTVMVETFSDDSYPKAAKVYGGAKVIARAKDQDLAVIRFTTRDKLPGTLKICPRESMPKDKGLPVLTVGCDTGEPPTCVADATAEKRLVRRPGVRDAVLSWEVSKEPAKGRSGGALVDREGRLIGVCSGRSDGKGYYCHVREIHDFLKKNGLKWLGEDMDGKSSNMD